MITGDDLPAERFVHPIGSSLEAYLVEEGLEAEVDAGGRLAHVGALEGLLLVLAALWVEASLAAWSPFLGSSDAPD